MGFPGVRKYLGIDLNPTRLAEVLHNEDSASDPEEQ